MADELKVVEPEPAVPVAKVKKPKTDTTTEMLETAESEDMSPDINLDKKAFWTGFTEKCAALNVNALELYKYAKEKKKHKMPHFTDQDRPKKVKDIYEALKRDHPEMPAESKARIAESHGEKAEVK